MEAYIYIYYTLTYIPRSQALYINKGCAQCLGGLWLCNHSPAMGSDVPHPIPWSHSHRGMVGSSLLQAAAVGLGLLTNHRCFQCIYGSCASCS